MNTGNITLTPADKQILNSYCHLSDGLSSYLGDGYEMVLHSLEDYEPVSYTHLPDSFSP